jgi:hypothetical protein
MARLARRLRLRFSLRTIFIFALITGVTFSVFGVRWFDEWAERRFLSSATAHGNHLRNVSDSEARHEMGFGFGAAECFRGSGYVSVRVHNNDHGVEFVELAKKYILKIKKPVELNLAYSSLDPETILRCFELPFLKVVHVFGQTMPDALSRCRLQSPQEIFVKLTGCVLTKESLKWLMTQPNIKMLSLERCQFRDEWFAEIETEKCNVAYLEVSPNMPEKPTPHLYELAGKLRQLQHFDVSGMAFETQFDEKALRDLIKSKSLRSLAVIELSSNNLKILLEEPHSITDVFFYPAFAVKDTRIRFSSFKWSEPWFEIQLDDVLSPDALVSEVKD